MAGPALSVKTHRVGNVGSLRKYTAFRRKTVSSVLAGFLALALPVSQPLALAQSPAPPQKLLVKLIPAPTPARTLFVPEGVLTPLSEFIPHWYVLEPSTDSARPSTFLSLRSTWAFSFNHSLARLGFTASAFEEDGEIELIAAETGDSAYFGRSPLLERLGVYELFAAFSEFPNEVRELPTVLVGVTDTGVDERHSLLKNTIAYNTSEIPGNGIDDDQNGFIDDVIGWNTVTNTPHVVDTEGHGTSVAGLIAARAEAKNSTLSRVVGVSPNARVVVAKVFDSSYRGDGRKTNTSHQIKGIDYLLRRNPRLMNFSLTGEGRSAALEEMLGYVAARDILMIAASGNNGKDVDSQKSPGYFPASFPLAEILSVGATAKPGIPARFSNYGRTSVDVFAPGAQIPVAVQNGGIRTSEGTSLAAPILTGLAAILRGLHPEWSAIEVRNALLHAVDRSEKLLGLSRTGGEINARKLIPVIQNKPHVLPDGLEVPAGEWFRFTSVGIAKPVSWSIWTLDGNPASDVTIQPDGTVETYAPGAYRIRATGAEGAQAEAGVTFW